MCVRVCVRVCVCVSVSVCVCVFLSAGANGYVPNKADQPTAGTRANTLCVKANSRKMLEA